MINNMNRKPNQHTAVPVWEDFSLISESISQDNLYLKSALIGRIGLIYLSCGVGSWRIQEAINQVSNKLGISCVMSFGIRTIEYSCFQQGMCCTNVLSIPNVGVNTTKLAEIQRFVNNFEQYLSRGFKSVNSELDLIEKIGKIYPIPITCLFSGVACGSFTFLIGGGIVEIICALLAATSGYLMKIILEKYSITITLNIILTIFTSCISYDVILNIFIFLFGANMNSQAGYIGAILFIVPGFPFITSCLDISKLYIRSGVERLTYSLLIIILAAISASIVATLLQFTPEPFVFHGINPWEYLILRLFASALGVYGFSVLFNSKPNIALYAAIIGSISNTIRLELIDLGTTQVLSAIFGSLIAGILASLINKHHTTTRISLTIPSVVIMVPGSYIYRAIFLLSNNHLDAGGYWITQSIFILLSLPIGLLIARIITDKNFRHCS
ncbi:threonine/serine exporter family protein [Lactococcus garvieae]|uniref:threonine/serine ThrE exporter family protein n=1 Tax=Lactococcus garvieae TaxID=1363 RepID=UPI001F615950|nr:threonine/serine exporter family protein [Lactococcus garvieae]MCI3861388.1 threonine/serine exporter family protein [Lactococcus garvieae]